MGCVNTDGTILERPDESSGVLLRCIFCAKVVLKKHASRPSGWSMVPVSREIR